MWTLWTFLAGGNITFVEPKILLTSSFAVKGIGSYICHSPGWDILLGLALQVSRDKICFEGEGTVHSDGDFSDQPPLLSLGSYTHSLLNITISRLVISVFHPAYLLFIFTVFHISFTSDKMQIWQLLSRECSRCAAHVLWGQFLRVKSSAVCGGRKKSRSCRENSIRDCCRYELFLLAFITS